jgi:hypothetical protein
MVVCHVFIIKGLPMCTTVMAGMRLLDCMIDKLVFVPGALRCKIFREKEKQ